MSLDISEVAAPAGLLRRHLLRSQQGQIYRIAWSPDGMRLAGPTIFGAVHIWDPQTGVLTQVLRGHTGATFCVSWAPDGASLASAADDRSVRIWNAAEGSLARVLTSDMSYLLCAAWAPDGRYLAVAGGSEYGIELWDPHGGARSHTLRGHSAVVSGLAWAPDGRQLASVANDGSVCLWDVADGTLMRKLDGHTGPVRCVAWSPAGDILASGGQDKTIHLWDSQTGRKVGGLEGHTGAVTALAFSADGTLLASGATDGSVRVWHFLTRETLVVLKQTAAGRDYWPGLAFHPRTTTLAMLDEADTVVALWDLDPSHIVSPVPTIHYINAKVVLLGESSVGKSGLGIRIAESQFRPTESTHGAQFWHIPLPPQVLGPRLNLPNICAELTLWDLAGQTEYHLIHQLFLDDTDVALLLFDCSDPTDPFRGVPYWVKVLKKQAPPYTLKFLVSARNDVSPITVERRELNQFIHQHELDGYFSTSAKTGDGIAELMRRAVQSIPWEKLPRTTTPHLFQVIRELLLARKSAGETLIAEVAVTREVLAQCAATPLEIATVINLLQSQGLIYELHTTRQESQLLLRPELINQYAAAIIQAARSHPRGIGAVPERDVLIANIPISGFERLSAAEEKTVLESTVELLIHHDLCFREMGLLVFPSQSNVSRPLPILQHPPTEVTYEFSGSVEAIYASLVVRLSYTDYFEREDQWKYAVEFSRAGQRLGFAMHQAAEGVGEIEIYFYPGVSDFDRVTFIRFITDHLNTKGLDIRERIRLYCPQCQNEVQNREAIAARVAAGKLSIPCQFCDASILIPRSIEERYRSDRAYGEKQQQLLATVEQRTHQEVKEFQSDHLHYTAREPDTALRILHLADWHITGVQEARQYRAQLEADLIQELDVKRLDYIVIAGDVAAHATPEEYQAAFELLDGLVKHFGLDGRRVIVAPGNHDVNWDLAEAAYPFVPQRRLPSPLVEGQYIPAGEAGVLLRDEALYLDRFAHFNQHFYRKVSGGLAYPPDYAEQGVLHLFPEDQLVFLSLNSAWETDHHYTHRVSLHGEALQNALAQVRAGSDEAWLKVAVWHHSLAHEGVVNGDQIQMLAAHGFQLGLHGHVHDTSGLYQYDSRRDFHSIGAGVFGAPTHAVGSLMEYNLLICDPDSGKITVETRRKERSDSLWFADARWGDRNNPAPRYTLTLKPSRRSKATLKTKAFEALRPDAYAAYETGLRVLLERLTREHPRYSEALVYQHRLTENIAKVRRYGKDTDDLEVARFEVLERLDQLAGETLGVTFSELCE